MSRLIAATLCVIALGAPQAGATTIAMNPLARVSVEWSVDWANKNLGAVLSLYTDDAVFVNADGSRVAGRSDLRKFFASVLGQYNAHPSLRSAGNSSSGDLGYDWGDYVETVETVSKPVQVIRTRGTYLVILRKVAGHWLIAEQLWNGNVPVPVRK